MQRVIQRTATARKQAQSKAVRARKAQERVDRMDRTRSRKDYNSAIMSNIKNAREARWDEYMKKDLAPMRDSGSRPHTFGASDAAILHPPDLPRHKRRKHILFAAGDRVCIIRGRDKGRINEITQVNKGSETVTVKDINMVWSPLSSVLPLSRTVTNKCSYVRPKLWSLSGPRSPWE